jgi:bacterioferritin-associated ferredoxin
VLVCHCKVVSDREIQEVIARGARDEFDVAEACGAGSGCGGCVPAVTALLAEGRCAAGCPIPGALQPATAAAPSRASAG